MVERSNSFVLSDSACSQSRYVSSIGRGRLKLTLVFIVSSSRSPVTVLGKEKVLKYTPSSGIETITWVGFSVVRDNSFCRALLNFSSPRNFPSQITSDSSGSSRAYLIENTLPSRLSIRTRRKCVSETERPAMGSSFVKRCTISGMLIISLYHYSQV